MNQDKKKRFSQQRRKKRNYWKIRSVSERPRLSVFRSARHIYVQIIDDSRQSTLAACSTLDKDFPKAELKKGRGVKAAEKVGSLLADKAKKLGIQEVVFDRSYYRYHGRVKALAEAARKSGLKF